MPGRRGFLSLFPGDDLLAKEIRSWKSFGDGLRLEDRKIFNNMIRQCYKYLESINAKGEPYTTESLMLSLILIQHKMIDFLINSRK
ncbi:MAG: hypothetical protein HKM23_02185 [Nitrosopumilus sp.]|nr:hypothetical protein [Nitrosopumilus sp.]